MPIISIIAGLPELKDQDQLQESTSEQPVKEILEENVYLSYYEYANSIGTTLIC